MNISSIIDLLHSNLVALVSATLHIKSQLIVQQFFPNAN